MRYWYVYITAATTYNLHAFVAAPLLLQFSSIARVGASWQLCDVFGEVRFGKRQLHYLVYSFVLHGKPLGGLLMRSLYTYP